MKESEIEKKVCAYAEKKGFLQYKFTSPSSRAVPDRIFMYWGFVFFIEFKSFGEKPTDLQAYIFSIIEEVGNVNVFVVDSVTLGIRIINKVAKLRQNNQEFKKLDIS